MIPVKIFIDDINQVQENFGHFICGERGAHEARAFWTLPTGLAVVSQQMDLPAVQVVIKPVSGKKIQEK